MGRGATGTWYYNKGEPNSLRPTKGVRLVVDSKASTASLHFDGLGDSRMVFVLHVARKTYFIFSDTNYTGDLASKAQKEM